MAGSDDERRFTDEEFALVLRKAVELQERTAERSTSRGGLSLADMQQIAREAGIDPKLIADATALLPNARAGGGGGFVGGATKYRLETTVAGELPEESYDRIVEAIRRGAEHQGEISRPLRGLEWTVQGEISQLSVNVTPRDGETSIQVVADRGSAVFLVFFLSFMAWVITTVAVGASLRLGLLPSLGIVAGGILGWLVTGRTIFKVMSRGYAERLQRILEGVTVAARRAMRAIEPAKDEPAALPAADGEP